MRDRDFAEVQHGTREAHSVLLKLLSRQQILDLCAPHDVAELLQPCLGWIGPLVPGEREYRQRNEPSRIRNTIADALFSMGVRQIFYFSRDYERGLSVLRLMRSIGSPGQRLDYLCRFAKDLDDEDVRES